MNQFTEEYIKLIQDHPEIFQEGCEFKVGQWVYVTGILEGISQKWVDVICGTFDDGRFEVSRSCFRWSRNDVTRLPQTHELIQMLREEVLPKATQPDITFHFDILLNCFINIIDISNEDAFDLTTNVCLTPNEALAKAIVKTREEK